MTGLDSFERIEREREREREVLEEKGVKVQVHRMISCGIISFR